MQKTTMKNYTILLTCCAIFMLSSCKEEAPQMMGPRGPVEVEVTPVKTEPIRLETELPGRTTAYRVAEVRPQVNGIIQKRAFTEGSEVTAGQLLYQIDPAIYQARYDSAQAALARAEAVEYSARLKAKRYESLVQTKAVSEQDQIENAANWKQAQADVAAAKAELYSTKINLDYTRITAPISGVIGKSFITEGSLVSAQQANALAIIQQLDPLYVDVTQSSTEILRLKKKFSAINKDDEHAQKPEVGIILEDGSEYEHKGALEFSDVTVDQSTGTVTVRTIIANPKRELLPGMFVRAKLLNREQNLIMIPSASLARTQKGEPFVMVVNSESKVEPKVLVTGRDIGEKTLVLEGLNIGDTLVTAGLQNIRPGMDVTTVTKADVDSTEKAASPAAKGE
jgi:membrane fusion protein (multidrug efflux system)